MSTSDLFSFVERRGIFDLGGVSFAVTEVRQEPAWEQPFDHMGRSVYIGGEPRVVIQAVSVRLWPSLQSAPSARPKPRREPLARWAHIRKRQPWALQVPR